MPLQAESATRWRNFVVIGLMAMGGLAILIGMMTVLLETTWMISPADLKAPSTWPIAPILVGMGLILLAPFLRKRPMATPEARDAGEEGAKAGPAKPPQEAAYEDLELIAEIGLIEKGKLAEHYSEVAYSLRCYVEDVYNIPAPDLTTDELVSAMREVGVDEEQIRRWQGFLAECDLVKFAQHAPPVEKARELIPQARRIVKATRPLPTSPNEICRHLIIPPATQGEVE